MQCYFNIRGEATFGNRLRSATHPRLLCMPWALFFPLIVLHNTQHYMVQVQVPNNYEAHRYTAHGRPLTDVIYQRQITYH